MTDNFLFHEVSEKEREIIKKQAKEILDNFSKELSKVENVKGDFSIERKSQEREENKVECAEIDRKIMFENAPEVKGDFIVAEKKEWK